jgi:hypothetical protein
MKRPPQPQKEFAVFLRVTERPGKLHQQATEAVCPKQRPQAFTERRDFLPVKNPIVCEMPVKFGREPKLTVRLHLAHPNPALFRANDPAERVVNFHGVEMRGDELQRVLPVSASPQVRDSGPAGGTAKYRGRIREHRQFVSLFLRQ